MDAAGGAGAGRPTSPKYGEKASYYSAICLETGAVLGCRVEGTTTAATTVCFLRRLRAHVTAPLSVIWDNGAAHRGPELREYLRTPDLRLQLVALPPYSPDFNPDEAVWKWVREEVTANTCFGTAEAVAAAVHAFWVGVDARADEVKRRCRSALQSLAFPVPTHPHPSSPQSLARSSM